ncbi:MAG: ABC transporter permease [Anaeromusa sp.]|nr:nickel transporter permease [Anaeromusa sp.]MDD3158025.1 ABC transporter permease [Anaeromusa sp.]
MRRYRSLFFYGLPVCILLAIAAFAPHLAPHDPYMQDLSAALKAPDSIHWLGTDRYGRDVFSRVLVGAQTTIFSSLLLLGVIALFGSLVGIVSGYCSGRVDACLMRLADVFLAFPEMVFAVAVAAVLGGGILNAVGALALVAWPKYARLARGLVFTVRHMPYITVAKMNGTTSLGVMKNHILPNIAGPVMVTAALDVGTIMMELAGLSFLGLGAMPPMAEWGAMMNNGRSMIQTAPWVVLAPGGAIFLTVAVFNLFGDRVRDYLDPKQLKG